PLSQELLGAIAGRSKAAKGVRLIANLQCNKLRAQDVIRRLCFQGRIFFCTLSKIDSVKASPAGGIEKRTQIAQRDCRGNGPALDRLARIWSEYLKWWWSGRSLCRVPRVL